MNPKLQEILESIEALEPFPGTAIMVLEKTLAGDPDPLDLAEVVKLDVGITAKVLKLANSAQKGTIVEVKSIEQAAVKLGSNELMRMVMTSAAHSFYSGLGAATPRSSSSLWIESVTNAIASRMVSEYRGTSDADVAFTAGLTMNMGHVVMDRFLRSERDEILGRVDFGMKMLRAEKEVLGVNHAELSARLSWKWGFPQLLFDAIQNHHAPERGENHELCADLNLAEALTWHALGTDGASKLAYGLSSSTMKFTEVATADMVAMRDALPQAVESELRLLGLDDMPKFGKAA